MLVRVVSQACLSVAMADSMLKLVVKDGVSHQDFFFHVSASNKPNGEVL